MEIIDNIGLGFATALSFQNIIYCFIGVLLGTLIGVLPGLGPVATIAMLLPITYQISDPTTALIMLAGIYYGAQYGGSTTAILVNLPGETSSVVTTLDGYQLARKGRPGPALAIAAIGSFIAGSIATVMIAAFAPPMAELAFRFGPAEYTSLMVMGLVAAVVLAHGSVVKALAMIVLGLLLGTVGTDINTGTERFTLGFPELADGLSFTAVAMGIFGLGEIIANLEQREKRKVFAERISGLLPSAKEFKRSLSPILRGTALGSFLGVLPGGGGILSSFTSYAVEKKLSSTPEKFGSGMIEGVAGPEAANNAGAQASFIPMLTLGIPTNAVMALMVAGMMIHSIQPGPQVMTSNPDLFWGLVTSMWIGNAMLLILNLPFVGIWIRLLTVPYRVLYPAILLFCCVGVYSINNNVFDVVLIIPFAILGYLFRKLNCEPAPLLLGLVLGPLLEEYLRRALILSHGDWSTFVTEPLSLGLLAITAALLVIVLVPAIARSREDAFADKDA